MDIHKPLIILSFLAAAEPNLALAAKSQELAGGTADNDHAIGREYLAGSFATRNSNYAEAATLFEEALLKNPNDILLLRNTYRSMLLSGNYDKAAIYAQKHLEHDKKSADAALLAAIYEVHKGNFAKASSVLDGLEQNKTIGLQQLIMPFIRSWILAGKGNYDAAINSLDPHDTGNIVSATFISLQLALLYSISGHDDLAEKTFATLMSEKGIMPYHLTKSAASFYESIGKWDEASKIYARYRITHPSVPHFDDIDSKMRDKISDGLHIKTPKAALAEVMKEASRLLFASGAANEGLVYLRLALMLEPDDDEANILLASNFDDQKDWGAAIAIYDRIPAKSDFYNGAQINKAQDLYSIGKKSEAKKLLLKTAKNTQAKYISLVTLADTLRRDNEYKEAAEIYGKILENIDVTNKASWAIYFGRGMCLERIGKWKIAEADFIKALELSPHQPEVVNYLAYSWIEHNENLEQARNMLLRAASNRPEDPQILDSAGWALYKMQDYENALLFLEKSTQIMPQDAVINDHLGDIYWMLGRKYEARYQWQRAIKYGPAESSTKEQLENKIAKGLEYANPR